MQKKHYLTGAVAVVAILASVTILYLMSPLCLHIKNGDTGKTVLAYPVKNGDEFSVTFIHSVNNTPVTDVYEIRDKGIYVVRTIYYSFGAGMQTVIEDDQTLEFGPDGSMIVSGFNRKMDNLSYIVGTVSDHILEIGGKTISLREQCGKNKTVRFSCGRSFILNCKTSSK
jgi:hypothetical protein